MKKYLIAISAIIAVLSMSFTGMASAAGGGNSKGNGNKDHKIDLCHYTESGSYEKINIAKNAVPNAHLNHHNNKDIIPPFDDFPGLNWNAANEKFLNDGCETKESPSPGDRPEDTTSTEISYDCDAKTSIIKTTNTTYELSEDGSRWVARTFESTEVNDLSKADYVERCNPGSIIEENVDLSCDTKTATTITTTYESRYRDGEWTKGSEVSKVENIRDLSDDELAEYCHDEEGPEAPEIPAKPDPIIEPGGKSFHCGDKIADEQTKITDWKLVDNKWVKDEPQYKSNLRDMTEDEIADICAPNPAIIVFECVADGKVEVLWIVEGDVEFVNGFSPEARPLDGSPWVVDGGSKVLIESVLNNIGVSTVETAPDCKDDDIGGEESDDIGGGEVIPPADNGKLPTTGASSGLVAGLGALVAAAGATIRKIAKGAVK